jgi:hypothetical protein
MQYIHVFTSCCTDATRGRAAYDQCSTTVIITLLLCHSCTSLYQACRRLRMPPMPSCQPTPNCLRASLQMTVCSGRSEQVINYRNTCARYNCCSTRASTPSLEVYINSTTLCRSTGHHSSIM